MARVQKIPTRDSDQMPSTSELAYGGLLEILYEFVKARVKAKVASRVLPKSIVFGLGIGRTAYLGYLIWKVGSAIVAEDRRQRTESEQDELLDPKPEANLREYLH